MFALIDEEDYHDAVNHLWYPGNSAQRAGLEACYPCRKENGCVIWLHKWVLTRAKTPPSPKHHIGDHINGKTLDCRRDNLRWATMAMNNRNRYGRAFYQPEML